MNIIRAVNTVASASTGSGRLSLFRLLRGSNVRNLGTLRLAVERPTAANGLQHQVISVRTYKRGSWYQGKGNERFYLTVMLLVTAAHFLTYGGVKLSSYLTKQKEDRGEQKRKVYV